MGGRQFVDANTVNAQAKDLPAIFHTLTDGVLPESGRVALDRLRETGEELQNALGRLGVKLGELADIWQAPSTEQGSNAIRDVREHVDKLGDHAGQLGSAFGDYIDHVGTARARVPEPQWFDEIVKSPTPEQALWLGPVLPILEGDLQRRTDEARDLMQGLTYAAYAVDAATPGFEPLPSQVVDPPSTPGGPSVRGGRRRSAGPMPGGSGQAATGNPSAAPQLSPATPPPVANPATLAPDQLTAQSNAGPQVTVATPVTVDSARIAPPGGSAGVGGLPLPGGQSTGAVGRGAGGGPHGRGGQSGGGNFGGGGGGPGRGSVGAPRGAGFPGRDGLAGRGASGRAGAMGVGGPMGAGGGGHGGDDDYEHQRAAYLHADETADELFGTDELTAPPVIGGPDE